jgi:hypothetical protein
LTLELKEPFKNDGKTHFRYTISLGHGGFNSDDNHTYNFGRVRISVAATLANALDQMPPLVLQALEKDPQKRTSEESARIFAHWREQNPNFTEETKKIDALYAKVPQPTWALVAAESKTPRVTRLFERGEQTHPKHVVKPHVPKFLHGLPEGDPTSRLTFAKWLVDPASPVAARVVVNRIWQAYFGVGILETSEDFGHQAAIPSHPKLLDWLAVEFMESGWDMKHIHRLIVTSATYRQSSLVSAELLAKDPKNRLLARGPRFRVPAETVRDIQLTTSGLLDPKLGGRSVFPPAPRYLFERPVSYGPKTWPVETDSERYRRALYTFRFRSVPYPMLVTFDAPTGSISCVRRTVSTTPLQALVTLNEQVSLEAALGLAHRMLTDKGTLEQRVARAFERCTSRKPDADEVATLVTLHNANLSPDPEQVKLFRESYKPATIDLSDHADGKLFAAATVARALLNLDETIIKN